MAGNERLGASFSIDVSQLQQGLQTANRLIRESQSEFRAAAAGLDDWSKSEEGLTARISSLSKIIDVQKEKVNALKANYQKLIDQGLDPASDEAIRLRTQINNEEAALRSNEAELKRNTSALADMGEESEKSGEAISKLGDIAKAAGAVMATAFAAAGAAIVGLTKAAIQNYAEYEQLVGGVETLFDTASDKVLEYANNAYKTAGLSANAYMETVTSFSASLLQGLGGDTEKAAEVANLAITDMSDNANKMGTSMESIQTAYQGFAKQNYTMLDNLKLGYGGTQAEMARLINDSGVLGDSFEVTAETVKDVSFDKLIEAIHVIQTNMGITGTTAKEASTTIQGSLSAMQGAWANLLTGMADESANIDVLIDNLVDSIGTFLQNLLPRILVALNGIIKMVQSLLPQIPALLQQFLPTLLQSVESLLTGVMELLPAFMETILAIVPDLLTSLINMLPLILETLVSMVVQIINTLTELIPTIVQAIMEVLPTLITALINAIPQLLEAAIKLLTALVDALPTIRKALIENLPMIIDTIVNMLVTSLPTIIDAAVQLFLGIIQAMPEVIKVLIANMPMIIRSIVNGLITGIPAIIKAGGQLLAGLFNGLIDVKAIANKIKELGGKIVDGIKSFFGIHSPSKLMEQEIGKNLALGIGEGFENNIGAVNAEISRALSMPDYNVSVNRSGAGTLGRTVVVNQYNTYSQAHSRYELFKTKQQTAAAVQLALAEV